MLVELNIEKNQNVNEAEDRTFMGKGKSRIIEKTIFYPDNKEEASFEVHIVGWENGHEIPAKALLVEDSGDGDAWLIYGGNEGIRLRKSVDFNITQKFSLEEPKEWGEKFLYYHASLYDIVIAPYII